MCEMSPIDSFVFVIERDSPFSFIRGYLPSNTSNKIYSLNIKTKDPLQNTNKLKGKIYKVSEVLILGSATQTSWRQRISS